MPDTATAPTATQAQLRAAGSRMLGFYLGGGGAKVDCLFDTAHFVTRDAGGAFMAPSFMKVGEGVGANSSKFLVNTVAGAAAGIQLFQDGTESWIMENVASSTALRWTQSGGERMRLTSTGLGVGTNNPAARGHFLSTAAEAMRVETTTARGGGLVYMAFNDPSGRKGYFGYGAATDQFYLVNEMSAAMTIQSGTGINLVVGGANIAQCVSGAIRPGTDNAVASGASSLRWSVVYSATGTINTSDQRFKLWITIGEDRTAKDRRIARRIFGELGWYQFIDAVTEKGADGARWHFGARAQRVWQIVAEEGLAPPLVDVNGVLLPDLTWTGPVAPAWLTFDCWNEEWEAEVGDVTHIDEVIVGYEPTGVLGPDGTEVMRAIVEEQERVERELTGNMLKVRDAGHIFGFRVDEMQMLLAWSLHDRLAALETPA